MSFSLQSIGAYEIDILSGASLAKVLATYSSLSVSCLSSTCACVGACVCVRACVCVCFIIENLDIRTQNKVSCWLSNWLKLLIAKCFCHNIVTSCSYILKEKSHVSLWCFLLFVFYLFFFFVFFFLFVCFLLLLLFFVVVVVVFL